MTAVDEHAEAHRLKREGHGARRIAAELGITRYAAGQLLKQPPPQPVADQEPPVAEPVGQVAEVVGQVAEVVADRPTTLAGQAPAGIPAERLLVIELDRFPGLADDLAVLQHTGASAAEIVNFAVDKIASVYRTALARGVLREGQKFAVVDMRLRPAVPARPAA
jgi:hypothetical protein